MESVFGNAAGRRRTWPSRSSARTSRTAHCRAWGTIWPGARSSHEPDGRDRHPRDAAELAHGRSYVKVCLPAVGRSTAWSCCSIRPPTPRLSVADDLDAEHHEESTLAFFALRFPGRDGRPRDRDGDLRRSVFLFPPPADPRIWTDPRLDFATTLEERLLAAGCLHSRSGISPCSANFPRDRLSKAGPPVRQKAGARSAGPIQPGDDAAVADGTCVQRAADSKLCGGLHPEGVSGSFLGLPAVDQTIRPSPCLMCTDLLGHDRSSIIPGPVIGMTHKPRQRPIPPQPSPRGTLPPGIDCVAYGAIPRVRSAQRTLRMPIRPGSPPSTL